MEKFFYFLVNNTLKPNKELRPLHRKTKGPLVRLFSFSLQQKSSISPVLEGGSVIGAVLRVVPNVLSGRPERVRQKPDM